MQGRYLEPTVQRIMKSAQNFSWFRTFSWFYDCFESLQTPHPIARGQAPSLTFGTVVALKWRLQREFKEEHRPGAKGPCVPRIQAGGGLAAWRRVPGSVAPSLPILYPDLFSAKCSLPPVVARLSLTPRMSAPQKQGPLQCVVRKQDSTRLDP